MRCHMACSIRWHRERKLCAFVGRMQRHVKCIQRKADSHVHSSWKEKLAARNLAPATTEIQHQRRMLKLGLSKHLYLKSLINYQHRFTEESYTIIADTNAHGLLECAIAMISDDNFTSCRSFKVLFKFMMMSM